MSILVIGTPAAAAAEEINLKTIKDVVYLGWSGEAIEMENLFIILRLVRQHKVIIN